MWVRLLLALYIGIRVGCTIPKGDTKALILWGERNSGTRWVESLLRRNMDLMHVRSVNGSQYSFSKLPGGWKHACAPSSRQIDSIFTYNYAHWEQKEYGRMKVVAPMNVNILDVLFVTLSKNPYSWLVSMFHRPYYHNTARRMSFPKFVQAPYPAKAHSGRLQNAGLLPRENDNDEYGDARNIDLENYWDSCYRHHKGVNENCLCSVCTNTNITDKNSLAQIFDLSDLQKCQSMRIKISRPSFASPIQMWNIKMSSFIALHQSSSVVYSVHLRYEDILNDPKEAVDQIVKLFRLRRRSESFLDRDVHVKLPPSFSKGAYNWHQYTRDDLKSQYLEGGWKMFYRMNMTSVQTCRLLAVINAQLDPVVMDNLRYKYWLGD